MEIGRNKIYFREEIGFDNGLGREEFEGEREMSRVMAHRYLAWETRLDGCR